MKRNKIYESLIDKSIGSMLSAIEIYNKPDFKYREETFAILAINSWELLFKARLLKKNNYKLNAIYKYKPYINKDGSKSNRKKAFDRNRSGNPKSISIIDAISRLNDAGELPTNLKENVEALMELRDNAIHFINTGVISKQVQELGFACIKNYIAILKKWYPQKGLNKYNLYLMPLAYIDNKIVASSAITQEVQNFISLVKEKMAHAEPDDTDYDIAIKIALKFEKGNSFDCIGVQFDKAGLPISLSEEEIRQRYPLTYTEICEKAKARYNDFKRGQKLNSIMKGVKLKSKLYYERKLDTQSPKTQKKGFYSTNVWQELDKHYTKKIKREVLQ